MGRRARCGAVALAVLTAVAGTVVAGAVPAAAAVTITVTPSTGLLDGHVVDVEVAGLVPGADYVVSQCDERLVYGPCSAYGTTFPGPVADYKTDVAFVQGDGQGEASVRLKLRRTEWCAANPCSMRVFAAGSDDVVATTPLAFAPAGRYQWPTPEVELTVPDPLLEGSEVTVAVAGLDPWTPNRDESVAVVGICRDDETLDQQEDCRSIIEVDEEGEEIGPVHVDVAPDGTGSVTFDLPRHLDLYDPPEMDTDYDCARQGCVLVVSQRETAPADHGGPLGATDRLAFAPEWTPWPSADAFVDQALEPLECVTIGDADRAQIRQALTDRTHTASQLIAGASGGSFCPDDVGEVVRLYLAFFDRLPETGGLGYWLGRLGSGTTPTAMARAFGGTPEFRAMYGTVSNGTVVDRAYRNTLGREPDAAGRAYWVQRLDDGLARWRLLHHFARSPEMRNELLPVTTYARISWVLAGRAPTLAESVVLLADQNMLPGGGFHTVVSALLVSGEVP